MTQNKLLQLRQATDEVILEFKTGTRPDGPINWAALRCVQAAWVVTDQGETYAEVTIEEAAPECLWFRESVRAALKKRGWPAIRVVTEW
jgi:tryptophanase